MPAASSAPEIEAFRPSPLTAPMCDTLDATMRALRSRITVLAVVDPKSIPITKDFISVLLGPRPDSGCDHSAGVDRFQHGFDAAIQQFVLIEGFVGHIALKHAGLYAKPFCRGVSDEELRIGEGPASAGRVDDHAVDFVLAAEIHDQIDEDWRTVVVRANQIILRHPEHRIARLDEARLLPERHVGIAPDD